MLVGGIRKSPELVQPQFTASVSSLSEQPFSPQVRLAFLIVHYWEEDLVKGRRNLGNSQLGSLIDPNNQD
jgi:hypothetical protein